MVRKFFPNFSELSEEVNGKMSPSPEEFAKLLTQALYRIKKLTSEPIYQIEDELGIAIYRTRETIEKWRRGELPADLEQVEVVAKILLDKGGLLGREEFEDFLTYAGQPRPAIIWQEVHSAKAKVDGPAPNEYFVGREDKLKELLDAILDQETRVISLWGPGGVGKTARGTTAIDHLAPNKKPPKQFPDGILYFNFYGHYSFKDACRYIVDFFGEEVSQEIRKEETEETQRIKPRDAARTALLNKQALLVLDGAEEADDLGKLLDIRDSNKVLIVTRFRHTTHGRTVIDLYPPLPDEAVSILKAWSTNTQSGSGFQMWHPDSGATHATATEICDLVGCLPLALRLAGRYMAQCQISPAEYLELLKQTPLSVLHERERQHESVSILLKNSIEALKEEARNALAVIGLLSYDPFDPETLEYALEDSSNAILALGELVRFGMVNRLLTAWYQVTHRLIYTYSRERLVPPVDALKNSALYFHQFYCEIIEPNPRKHSIEPLKRHIIAIFDRCVKLQEWEAIMVIALIVFRSHYSRQDSHLDFSFDSDQDLMDAMTIFETAVKAAQITKNRELEAMFLIGLGSIGINKTPVDYYGQALVISRELNSRYLELRCLQGLGYLYKQLQEPEEFMKCFELALTISRELGDLRDEFKLLAGLGNEYYFICEDDSRNSRGDNYPEFKDEWLPYLEKAVDCNYEALIVGYKLIARADDFEYEALQDSWTTLLGACKRYSKYGQKEQAIEYYKRCIDLAYGVGNDEDEDKFLYDLVDFLWEQVPDEKLFNEITMTYQRLIELNPNYFNLYINLAFIHITFASPDEAIKYYQKRVELNPIASLDTYAGLGVCAYHQGKVDEARKYFETVLAIWEHEKEKHEHNILEIDSYLSFRDFTQGRTAKYLREQHYLDHSSIIGFKLFALIGTNQEEEAIATLRSASTELLQICLNRSKAFQAEDDFLYARYNNKNLPLRAYRQEEIIWVRYFEFFANSPNPPQMLDKLQQIIEEQIQMYEDSLRRIEEMQQRSVPVMPLNYWKEWLMERGRSEKGE